MSAVKPQELTVTYSKVILALIILVVLFNITVIVAFILLATIGTREPECTMTVIINIPAGRERAHVNDEPVECCTPGIKTYAATSKARYYCAVQGIMDEEGQLNIEGSSGLRRLWNSTPLPYCEKIGEGYHEIVCEGAKCDCEYRDRGKFAKACDIPFFRCTDDDTAVYPDVDTNITANFGCQFNLEYDGSTWKQAGNVSMLKNRTEAFVATKESPIPVHCAAANGGAQLTCTTVDCAKTLLNYTKTMKNIDEICGNVIATSSGSDKAKKLIWMLAIMTSAAITKGLRF